MEKSTLKQGEPNKNKSKADFHNDSDKSWWQPAFILFARLSVWIVEPVIVAVFVGKWLDKKYDSAPWLLLATVGMAFIVSMFGIVKSAITEYANLTKEFKNKKRNSKIKSE